MTFWPDRQLVFERLRYVPNPTQLLIHQDEHKTKLVAGGERAGKSFTTGMEGFSYTPFSRKGWIVGPDYWQCRPEFQYIRDAAARLDAIEQLSEPQDGKLYLRLRGGTEIWTRTGEDEQKLASEAIDFALMVEAAQQPHKNFVKLHNRLLEARKRGAGWMYVSGTFEGSLGWYPELYTDFQGENVWGARSFSLPTWSNTAVFALGERDPEILGAKARLDEATFMERFGGVPTPPKELVFREFRHTLHIQPMRFGDVEVATRDQEGWILPAKAELELWIDPGYAGAYAVLFVLIDGGLVFVVDEVYTQYETGPAVITKTTAKTALFERVRRITMDIAGRQHNAMESQAELWAKLTRLPVRSNSVAIADGILRHHTFLLDPLTRVPRLYHNVTCVGTIKEYGLYRYQEVKENRDERELPIDAHNHAMKAIAYGLYERFGVVERLSKPKPRNLIRDRARRRAA